jgi:hypothetical protein
VLAKDINALEPRLTRQGYDAKVLAELLNAKPRKIKWFLSGQLAAGRTQELQSELLATCFLLSACAAKLSNDSSRIRFRGPHH